MNQINDERIIGLDYGEKRIGVALSDPLLLTAQPREKITWKTESEVITHLKTLFAEYNINKMVIGIPKTLANTESEMTLEVSKFVKVMQMAFPEKEIIPWDERLTSAQAERSMIDGGMRREKRKQKIDSLAASIMLQSYLDFFNQSKSLKHEVKD